MPLDPPMLHSSIGDYLMNLTYVIIKRLDTHDSSIEVFPSLTQQVQEPMRMSSPSSHG